MGKVKQRSRKPFQGRQKKKGKVRVKKMQKIEPETTEAIEGQQTNMDEDKVHDETQREAHDQESQEHQREPDEIEVESSESINESISETTKSASARKLKIFEGLVLEENEKKPQDCYAFVQQSMMTELIRQLLCPVCKQPGIIFKVSDDKSGLAAKGEISCTSCNCFADKEFLCGKVKDRENRNHGFDINVRATLAFRGIGCGYAPMKQWLGIMNMPYTPSQNLYR